jgi:crotonobetainyl-CoA:carnitine CoA-transferase CaiB-like acyl-CoA transferase
MLNYMATMQSLSGREPGRSGNGHFVHVPYNTYRTRTRHVILAVITDQFWQRLVDILDAPDLRRDAYLTQPGRWADREVINARLQEILETESCEHWLARFGNQIPCAPVNDIAHAMADEQIRGRGMVVEVAHPSGRRVEMPGNPVKMSGMTDEVYTPPPLLGTHTDEVLEELLGLGAEARDALRARGIIG